jgi:phage tail sheath gpL-like
MAFDGFPLTGLDPNDPIPAQSIEIRTAQGAGSGAVGQRKVVFLAQKTSAGSEPVNEINSFIADEGDAVERFGSKSELLSQYRKYALIDPTAECYGIAIDAGAGTPSTVTFTFATAATAATTLVVEWAGESVEVPVASGDSVTTIATNAAATINDQFEWPWSAGNAAGVLTATVVSPLGPRGDYTLDGIRMYFRKNVTTTVTKGTNTTGATDDDHTTALGLLATRNIYYQISSKTLAGAGTASDNGIGEHATALTALALPAVGIRQELYFGFVGQASLVTTIAASLNNQRVKMIWAQGTSWTPAMVAAHYAAASRSKRLTVKAGRLTDYGLSAHGVTEIFTVPKPWLVADLPATSEVRSALNNGASVVNWTTTGQGFVVRDITTRSLNGTANDYRVRSGHIVPALDFAAEFIGDLIATTAQEFRAADGAEGALPIENTTTPLQVRGTIFDAIDQLVAFPGGPVLDPGLIDQMKASVEVRLLANGTSSKMRLEAPKHNDKTNLLILETSPGV